MFRLGALLVALKWAENRLIIRFDCRGNRLPGRLLVLNLWNEFWISLAQDQFLYEMIRIRLISRFWPIGKLHQSIRPPKSALLPRLGNINNKSLPATGIPLSRYPAIPLPLPHDFPLLAINCSFSPASVNFHFLFLLRPMFQKLQSRALPSFLPSWSPAQSKRISRHTTRKI